MYVTNILDISPMYFTISSVQGKNKWSQYVVYLIPGILWYVLILPDIESY